MEAAEEPWPLPQDVVRFIEREPMDRVLGALSTSVITCIMKKHIHNHSRRCRHPIHHPPSQPPVIHTHTSVV